MGRFLALALPLLLVLFALAGFAEDVGGFGPDMGPLRAAGVARSDRLAVTLRLGVWLLQSVGLVALFLLVQSRDSARWLDGLAAGWLAWIFRGPLLVITIQSLTQLPHEPWWGIAWRSLVLYTAAGLMLVACARRLRLAR